MKKLIFIDNDSNTDQLSTVKYRLELEGVNKSFTRNIEFITRFGNLSKKDQAQILFNPNHIIASYSMYTPNNHGSLYQMIAMLKYAGKNDIKNIIYIDGADKLQRQWEYVTDKKVIKTAITNNFIITLNNDEGIQRIVVNDTKKPLLKQIPFDLNNLLNA
jgi:hypothetical protein